MIKIKQKRANVEVGRQEDQIIGLEDLIQFLKDNKINMGDMAEVGVWEGGSSHIFADHFDKIYCVDHWQGSHLNPVVYDTFIENKTDNMIPLRGWSLEIAKQVPDNSLDFVYIDGDHRGEFVKKDILAWLPKIKKYGAIAGHDYGRTDSPSGFDFSGLTNAVDSIFKKVYTFKDTSWLAIIDRSNEDK